MRLDRDVAGHCRTTTLNTGKPFATHAERPRGFDVLVSTMLLALIFAAIALANPISGEIAGPVRIARAISHLQSILS